MKRILPVSFLLVILFVSCKKNINDELPPPPAQSAGVWTSITNADGDINHLFSYSSMIWIGGTFDNIAGNPSNGFARYDGTNFLFHVQPGLTSTTEFYEFTVHGPNIFNAGFYDVAGQIAGVSLWSGSGWVGNPHRITGPVKAIRSSQGNLYVGGSFPNQLSQTFNYVAMWNGTAYVPMASGFNLFVTAIEVYNNEIYAAGSFTQSGSTVVNHIARWDGTQWQPLGTGLNGDVNDLEVFNGELWVAGTFTNAGGQSTTNLAKWNGSAWSGVLTSFVHGAGGMKFLYAVNSELYFGGDFSDSSGKPLHVGKVLGSTVFAVGNGFNPGSITSVSSAAMLNSKLYVSGKTGANTTIFRLDQ
jgi:trimeric autotransporter adhesin